MKNLILITLFLITAQLLHAQLSRLNDEFNNPCTLSDWQRLNDSEGWGADQLEILAVDTEDPGKLTMKPYTCVWYNDFRGPLVYKLVEGDFVFTTQVEVAAASGAGLPSSDFSLAGCMIRAPKTMTHGGDDWAAGQENYVFLSVGHATASHASCPLNADGVRDCGPGPHFEVKRTAGSSSQLFITPIGSQTVTIRMARIGNVIIVLHQLPGGAFEVHQRYTAPDGFPGEVQVGLVSYTDWRKAGSYSFAFHNEHVLNESLAPDPTATVPFNPDLYARFEYARFNEVSVPAALAGLNLLNPAVVSDAQLLSFLGFDSEPAAVTAEDANPYLAVYEEGDGVYQFWSGMPWLQLLNRKAALQAEGLHLEDVDAYQQEDGQWRFNGLWRAGTENQALIRSNSWKAFVKQWKLKNQAGMRLVDIEVLNSGAAPGFVGVWQAGGGKYALYCYDNWKKFTKRWKVLADKGYRLIDVETFMRNGNRQYVGVWRGGEGKYAFYQYDTLEGFQLKEQELLTSEYRLIDVETIQQNGHQWYLGVWNEPGANQFRMYTSLPCLLNGARAMAEAGYRLVDVERGE